MSSTQNQESSVQVQLIDPEPSELNELDASLSQLERFLRLFGFCQYSVVSTSLSWIVFVVFAVAVPVVVIEFAYCSDCEKYQIRRFELQILISQAIGAFVSLLCVSHNLRKYGIRKLLFVDRHHGQVTEFRKVYLQKIRVFYRMVASWIIICFLLKAAREVTRLLSLHHDSLLWSIIILVASLVSWTYSTAVFLLGTALFNLVGNLQVIHFENYGKLLEMDLDVSVCIEEHMRLTYNLSKISHRFRLFLLLEFLLVSGSQFMALLQTMGNRGIINFTNGGDFAVLSIVQLVGILLCLTAAAKISHRAQGVGSVASRWHALATCSSNEASMSGISANGGNFESRNPGGSLPINYSESDLESIDYMPMSTNVQFTSSMSSYQKRQALVTYVQSNTGGFTIFGWMVDRMLVNTIFFMELTLVFFVLGKTVDITTR